MIIKKARLFWSYQINKTEQWLSIMAEQGWHVTDVNLWSRVFTFEKGEKKKIHYRIQYAKTLPETLKNEGWNIAASAGKWLFVSNVTEIIQIYPPRDSILKRNRTHAYTAVAIVIFQLALQMPILLISFIILSFMDQQNIWLLLLFLGEAIALACIAAYIFKSYRRFEVLEMDATIDPVSNGKKVWKLKPGWMYRLEETSKWLEQLALEGYVLEKVTATLFTFRKTAPTTIKYECVFEYKVQPSFFSAHKEVGWQLKYSSNVTVLNYSIWAMPYRENEPIPQFSYDMKEQKQSIKRAFKMNISMSIYIILISSIALYANTLDYEEPFISWSLSGITRTLLLAGLLFWLYHFLRIIIYYRKSMKAYQ
ncbi:Protein of unknown function [Gracilibacillus ureilyticus]|uniref:DUF2812 domain-containing protein n=1 Tax=Gracilibacillus ureilyticus TaxID=531814 RepID=A0A1H9V7P5_9BACI|nr:DUF2812 domain-containing protein [Gracilibacillus ureilyticus]SES17870.1 Protein of unknown function [Gracilibacillus ureilyticus]